MWRLYSTGTVLHFQTHSHRICQSLTLTKREVQLIQNVQGVFIHAHETLREQLKIRSAPRPYAPYRGVGSSSGGRVFASDVRGRGFEAQ